MSNVSRRRVLAGAGAAGAVALGLAACGNSSSGGSGGVPNSTKGPDVSKNMDGAMAKYGVGDQFKATKPLKFSIMMLSNPAYPYNANWLFFTELTKRTNISLDATVIPLSDYNQKRSVMISGGNAPMIIPKTYRPDEEQYIASGAILPVSDYASLMPNYSDQIKKWNLQSDIDGMRQDDGKYYLLPGLHESVWKDYSLAVRTDILKQLNLSVPKTWDDVLTMLRAMKTIIPAGGYPFSDRFSTPPQPAGANNLLAILGEAYGTQAGFNWQSTTFKNGQFVYTGAMDEYKQMLQYINTMISEKLLDPESFTQTDDKARQKFATGQSFVISCNAQTIQNENKVDIAKIPGATVVKIPVPIGPIGNAMTGSRLENGVMLSSKVKDSPNLVAMLQFIDWVFYSDTGKMFAKWGIEGTTYTGNINDGSFKLAPDIKFAGLNPTGTKNIQVEYGFYNGVFVYGGSTKLLNSQFAPEEVAFQEEMNKRKVLPVAPPHPLTADEREQVTLWDAGLKDTVAQNTVKFALGQRALSEWDTYVTELKGKNMQQEVDLTNASYQRYKKAHG
jgi:putative aldouronate transport system substrate-binding protein